MPCGKKSLVKSWDKPKVIRVVKPSKYEQNETSVRLHWKQVILDLESLYKDEKFWESQGNEIKGLVGPIVFERLRKIFHLPKEKQHYEPVSETSSKQPSELFYTTKSKMDDTQYRSIYSMSGFESLQSVNEEEEEYGEEEEEESYSETLSQNDKDSRRALHELSKTLSKMKSSIPKLSSKSVTKSVSSKLMGLRVASSTPESTATDDDIVVQTGGIKKRGYTRAQRLNPHYEMLYCNATERDMIVWKSNYKTKSFEISASDEFNNKADIVTKKIAQEFFEWWLNLGTVEFKSEIRRPEDIESLFQVWFDEHASRGLVVDPRTLTCVLESTAKAVRMPKASCSNVLKRFIAKDIRAETDPAHTIAFNTCLPQKLKHIPPQNNTKQLWDCVKIPEDLRSMSCVWEEIAHLTSTKEFTTWLEGHPFLPMPPYLSSLGAAGEKKQPFVIPSDFVFKDRSTSTSTHDLALPVSQFTMELKEVLTKLMNQ